MSTSLRLRIDLAYDGTDFHGWAKQKDPELRTVQGVMEDALSLVLRVPTALTVAGRTDAGVHAQAQVAHFDIPAESLEQRSIDGDPGKLVRRLAKLLPDDVAVRAVEVAPDGFDARFSALRRHYRYRVTTAESGPLPTRSRDTATWNRPVAIEDMQAAADALVGLHNFAAFCKARPHATTVRELQAFTWKDVSTQWEPQTYEAEVTADAFCWNMVRSLVSTCLMVGQGKREADVVKQLLGEAERSPLVPLAPAKGLSMEGVDYPPAEELASRASVTRARR